MSARRWLPPALWAALILVLTSIPSPPDAPGGIPHLDKVVHFVLYGGLGWLAARAVGTSTPRALALVVLAIAMFAGVDEWHQQFFARDPSIADWIAEWMVKPAGLVMNGVGSTGLPSIPTLTSDEAVTSSNIRLYGLRRKWCSGPGMRADKWVKMRSSQP